MMRTTRFVSVAVAIISSWWLSAVPALATPCMEEIAHLEHKLRDAKSNPEDQPTGKQTIGAQLSHQPTPESIAEADLRADDAVKAILDRAKAFDAANKTSECQSEVAKAKLHFGPNFSPMQPQSPDHRE